MMNKIALLFCLSLGTQVYADNSAERTEALHAEAKNRKNPNITKETHPVLYGMVQELATAANVAMPRYVTIHEAQTAIVLKDGTVHKSAANNVTAWVNALGDLHICDAIVTDLSYEEVKGIVAVAIAEKAKNKPMRLIKVGVGSYVVTLAAIYALNKVYKLNLGSFFFGRNRDDRRHYRDYKEGSEGLEALIYGSLLPAMLTAKLTSNQLQKQIDLEAAKLTSPAQVVGGIKALQKLEDSYVKEGIMSRIAEMLCLKQIFNTVFYPVRAYTPEERIAYVQAIESGSQEKAATV